MELDTAEKNAMATVEVVEAGPRISGGLSAYRRAGKVSMCVVCLGGLLRAPVVVCDKMPCYAPEP